MIKTLPYQYPEQNTVKPVWVPLGSFLRPTGCCRCSGGLGHLWNGLSTCLEIRCCWCWFVQLYSLVWVWPVSACCRLGVAGFAATWNQSNQSAPGSSAASCTSAFPPGPAPCSALSSLYSPSTGHSAGLIPSSVLEWSVCTPSGLLDYCQKSAWSAAACWAFSILTRPTCSWFCGPESFKCRSREWFSWLAPFAIVAFIIIIIACWYWPHYLWSLSDTAIVFS